ncbi:MAG: hypothetical protein KIT10_14635 [Flavobacteriales bacterium]|nr:hypothetical protein [Flavobacteriales bacterium]
MLYDLDIDKLVRRYAPGWFRHARNIALAQVLLAWVGRIQEEFLLWRTEVIIAQYRFNGLMHSLEWVLNDLHDALDRRIYITVVDQAPVMYHIGDGQPAFHSFVTEGVLTGYYHLETGAVSEPYLYEFLVHVPAELSFIPSAMFDLLDLYRFAGRRPAIRRFAPGDTTVEIILYHGLTPAANGIIVVDPYLETE